MLTEKYFTFNKMRFLNVGQAGLNLTVALIPMTAWLGTSQKILLASRRSSCGIFPTSVDQIIYNGHFTGYMALKNKEKNHESKPILSNTTAQRHF